MKAALDFMPMKPGPLIKEDFMPKVAWGKDSAESDLKTNPAHDEDVKDKEQKNPLDETEKVKFMNLDDPEEDIAFSYGPPGDVRHFHLYPGYEYELPKPVIQHLNSIQYTKYQVKEDEHGNFKHVPAGTVNRFACNPINR